MQSQNISMYASNRAFGAAVTKSGHKAAAFLQRPVLFLFFPLSVHSLLFSIGLELISETVSFRCTGTLFSDTQMFISSFFGFLFYVGDDSVYSLCSSISPF